MQRFPSNSLYIGVRNKKCYRIFQNETTSMNNLKVNITFCNTTCLYNISDSCGGENVVTIYMHGAYEELKWARNKPSTKQCLMSPRKNRTPELSSASCLPYRTVGYLCKKVSPSEKCDKIKTVHYCLINLNTTRNKAFSGCLNKTGQVTDLSRDDSFPLKLMTGSLKYWFGLYRTKTPMKVSKINEIVCLAATKHDDEIYVEPSNCVSKKRLHCRTGEESTTVSSSGAVNDNVLKHTKTKSPVTHSYDSTPNKHGGSTVSPTTEKTTSDSGIIIIQSSRTAKNPTSEELHCKTGKQCNALSNSRAVTQDALKQTETKSLLTLSYERTSDKNGARTVSSANEKLTSDSSMAVMQSSSTAGPNDHSGFIVIYSLISALILIVLLVILMVYLKYRKRVAFLCHSTLYSETKDISDDPTFKNQENQKNPFHKSKAGACQSHSESIRCSEIPVEQYPREVMQDITDDNGRSKDFGILTAVKGNHLSDLSNIREVDLMVGAERKGDAKDTNAYDKINFQRSKQTSQNIRETGNLYDSANCTKYVGQTENKIKGNAQDTNSYDVINFHDNIQISRNAFEMQNLYDSATCTKIVNIYPNQTELK